MIAAQEESINKKSLPLHLLLLSDSCIFGYAIKFLGAMNFSSPNMSYILCVFYVL